LFIIHAAAAAATPPPRRLAVTLTPFAAYAMRDAAMRYAERASSALARRCSDAQRRRRRFRCRTARWRRFHAAMITAIRHADYAFAIDCFDITPPAADAATLLSDDFPICRRYFRLSSPFAD